jgi:putative hydrolase of the HAD superfamily
MKEKNLILDLGGVLIDLNYQLTIQAFENLGSSNFKELYSQANQLGVFDCFETGEISTQRFINEILKYLPNGCNPNQVVSAWNAMILDFKESKIALLLQLKEIFNLFLLSNTNELHLIEVRNEWNKKRPFEFENCFDKVYYSHLIGMRKPSVSVFQYVCSENQLNPDQTLFIDDTIQHIQGAQKAGLKTLLHPQNKELNLDIILAQFDKNTMS